MRSRFPTPSSRSRAAEGSRDARAQGGALRLHRHSAQGRCRENAAKPGARDHRRLAVGRAFHTDLGHDRALRDPLNQGNKMTQNASTHGRQQHYSVPQPAPWPIMGSAALLLMAIGGVFVMNGSRAGWASIGAGFLLLIYMMVRWFGDVIRESEGGKYGGWEDLSFRWGMSWFIFSEVMFFGAFFAALFWPRVYSVPDLGSIESNALMWPGFAPRWPSAGPAFEEQFTPMAAWGIDRKSTRLNSSHDQISYAVFCLKKKKRI